MSNLFKTLEIEAFRAGITPRTVQSREWFRKKVDKMRNINRKNLMREEELQKTDDSVIGNMYMFFYDPKHKDTLPYYDKFPLVVVVGPAKDGFLGLNLHYLPPVLRAKFLDGLLDITTNKRYDDTTKFRLSYKMLQGAAKFKYFKPCLKHYLNDHVKGNFAKVSAPEYEIAVFLPTADWAKGNQNKIYSDSRRMI
jgi:hypothetical protein